MKLWSKIKQLHDCEQGAEALEKLLIVAAIALPLLGLLIFFRGTITEWVTGLWTDVQDDAQDYDYVNP
jgi:Flp pilus assembly pilin Flp